MKTQEITINDIVGFDDVRLLAGAAGPCITMLVHIPNPFELSTRLKNALRGVENHLTERRTPATQIESLLEPVRELARGVATQRVYSNALIVFRAPGIFRSFLLRRRPREIESVGERFDIRPLLSVLTRVQQFHLLCLSQRNIRLFRCTQHGFEEENLGETAPVDMHVWLNTRKPDHDLQNRSSGGHSVGSMKGVTFGTSTDREREDEYLAHFFKEVDRAVGAVLHNGTEPVVLAGVEYEIAIYRRVASNTHLLENAVHGSPDGLPDNELHERAVELAMQSFSGPCAKALSDFNKHQSSGRISLDIPEVVKAAMEGRAADLLLREDGQFRGRWNEETNAVEADDAGEDLLNTAAVGTVKNGGRAFALGVGEMPAPAAAAALLRY